MGEDYPGGSLSDSSPFLYGIDPYAFSEPSLFSDFGALDAPIADVNKIINAEPGDATIAASGTAVTQLGNMALDQGSMPGPAGDGLQSGNDRLNL